VFPECATSFSTVNGGPTFSVTRTEFFAGLATIGAVITGTITLVWQGMERLHKADTDRIRGEVEAARRQDKAEAEAARRQDKAEAVAARLQEKVEIYQYYVQAVGTRDHEPLMEAMSQRQKENKESAQAMMAGESGGKEGKLKKR